MSFIPAPNRNLLFRFRDWAHKLYSGRSANRRLFFYALLVFDLASLLFIIATSFLPRNELIRGLDVSVGIVFLMELMFRLAGSRQVPREFLNRDRLTVEAAMTEYWEVQDAFNTTRERLKASVSLVRHSSSARD